MPDYAKLPPKNETYTIKYDGNGRKTRIGKTTMRELANEYGKVIIALIAFLMVVALALTTPILDIQSNSGLCPGNGAEN